MIIVIGFVIAFILIVIFSRPGTRHCRWRRDRRRDEDGQFYHRCMHCGHEVWTETAKPPKICYSDARGE